MFAAHCPFPKSRVWQCLLSGWVCLSVGTAYPPTWLTQSYTCTLNIKTHSQLPWLSFKTQCTPAQQSLATSKHIQLLCALTRVIWRDFLYLYMIHLWDWLFICFRLPSCFRSDRQSDSQRPRTKGPQKGSVDYIWGLVLSKGQSYQSVRPVYRHIPLLYECANTPTLSAQSHRLIVTAGWFSYLTTF